jgi:uncharacterized protein involved in outer membrane biogenesis
MNDLKLGLRPSLVMDDILLQNAPWASMPEMVKIKRLEAKSLVIPLLNRNIQITRRDLVSGIFQLLNPSSKAANHTDINCGVSGFDIQEGIAEVSALVVDTPNISVVGEGQVNLRDETLDLALKPYSKGGLRERQRGRAEGDGR